MGIIELKTFDIVIITLYVIICIIGVDIIIDVVSAGGFVESRNSAEKLFNKVGFKKTKYRNFIEYKKVVDSIHTDYIYFWLNEKTYEAYTTSIDVKLFKAIEAQMEELKWL